MARQLHLSAKITVCRYNELTDNEKIPVLLAIAAENNGEEVVSPITPCGACRQVMRETELRYATPLRTLMCGAEDIYIAESAGDLLPLGFELPSH